MALGMTACAGELTDEQVLAATGTPSETQAGSGAGDDGTPTPGPDDMDPQPTEPACAIDVVQDVFAAKCGFAGCHGGAAPEAGLDLAAPDLASRVFGAVSPSSNDCGGRPLASADDPDESVLLIKLRPDYCGPSRMPLGLPLTDEEVACVRAWIAAGGET